MKFTEEHKKKLSEARKGKKPWNKGKEYPQIRGEKNGKWKGGKPICLDCGIKVSNYGIKRCVKCFHNSIKGEKNNLYKKERHFCKKCGKEKKHWNKSLICKNCLNITYRGKNHPNWKGGITSENTKIRNSSEYKAWRLSVYERDWFTCQMPMCGYKGKDIECHHIKKVKDNPELILDVSNGITLCKNCHKKIRNKEEQFVELFNLTIRLGIRFT